MLQWQSIPFIPLDITKLCGTFFFGGLKILTFCPIPQSWLDDQPSWGFDGRTSNKELFETAAKKLVPGNLGRVKKGNDVNILLGRWKKCYQKTNHCLDVTKTSLLSNVIKRISSINSRGQMVPTKRKWNQIWEVAKDPTCDRNLFQVLPASCIVASMVCYF